MDGGEASTTPEMGSADNTPTEEDVELVGTKPNSSGVGQGPEARAPEGTATGESAPGDEGSNPALSGGHQTPESDSPEAPAEPAVPVENFAAEGKIKAHKEKKQKEKMEEARNPKASGCTSSRCEEADHHQTPGNDDDAFQVPAEELDSTKRVASKKGSDPSDLGEQVTTEVPTSNNAPAKPSVEVLATDGKIKAHKEKKQKEKMEEARNPKASGCTSSRCEEADHHQTPGNDDDAFQVPAEELDSTKRVASKKGSDPSDLGE